MSDSPEQVCPLCRVKIVKVIGGDRVIFAVGPAGTRTTLWMRVCQYAKQPGCINKNPATDGPPQPKTY